MILRLTDEQEALVNDIFYDVTSISDIEKQLNEVPDNDPQKDTICSYVLNILVDELSYGYIRNDFGALKEAGEEELVQELEDMAHLARTLAKRHPWTWPFALAFASYLEGDDHGVKDQLEECLLDKFEDRVMTEEDFSVFVLTPFKECYSGFYHDVLDMLDLIKTTQEIRDWCRVLDDFYRQDNPERMAEVLYPMLGKYTDSVIGNTLLGFSYYTNKHWGNAIACFEKALRADWECMFRKGMLYFFCGWAHSKMKNHRSSITSYEKALELSPDITNALNNMGYEYYLLHQYNKALAIFQQCLDEERDFPYAVNNYARTLYAMKRYKDAKAFLKQAPIKVDSGIARKIQNADITNARIHKDPDLPEKGAESDVDQTTRIARTTYKDEQFSSEKILEDELVMRIESGMPVFGKTLKIYQRPGEYGRQYIIPVGRLDILAEDGEGNLYIIELKKDSGYDDAYAQTRAYLDWFEEHRKAHQQIFGIICLNGPDDTLIQKVRADSQMRLFNYQIVYEEIH